MAADFAEQTNMVFISWLVCSYPNWHLTFWRVAGLVVRALATPAPQRLKRVSGPCLLPFRCSGVLHHLPCQCHELAFSCPLRVWLFSLVLWRVTTKEYDMSTCLKLRWLCRHPYFIIALTGSRLPLALLPRCSVEASGFTTCVAYG
jgi:hypothetical protein